MSQPAALRFAPGPLAALALTLAAAPAAGNENELVFDLAPFQPPGVAGEVWLVSTQPVEIVNTRLEMTMAVDEVGPWSLYMYLETPNGLAGFFDSEVEGWTGPGPFTKTVETDELDGPIEAPDGAPFWSWFLHFGGGVPETLPGGGVALTPVEAHFTELRITFELAPCPSGDPDRPWTALGGAVAGSQGLPTLQGTGSACPSEPVTFTLANAAPLAPAILVVGAAELSLPLLGGLLVPSPDVTLPPVLTDATGAAQQTFPFLTGVPAGTPLWVQQWILDPGAPSGLAATNGLLLSTP